MVRLRRLITKTIGSDFLISNSIYLFINNILGAAVGFLFWIVAANLFSETEIGIATALLSASSLIAGISNLGLGLALIRYINQLSNKEGDELINTSICWSLLTTVLISAVYLLLLTKSTSVLSFITNNSIWNLVFVLGTAAMVLVTLTDQILLAHFSGKIVFLRSLIMHLIKLTFPLFLIFILNGPEAVFITFTIASLASTGFSSFQLKRNLRPKYVFKPNLNFILDNHNILGYALSNHIGSYFISLPYMIAPLIIIERFGETIAAQFYIGSMMAMLINSLAMSLSTSAFIQGSTKEGDTTPLIRALKIMALIILPITIVLYLASPLILKLFGSSYLQGIQLIRSLIIAAPFSGFALFFVANWRIKNHVIKINIFGLLYALGLLLPLLLLKSASHIGLYLIIGNIPALTYGLINASIKNQKEKA